MTTPARRLLLALAAVALLAVGCGISSDDEPRVIPPAALPDVLVSTPTTTTIPIAVETDDRLLYFARTDAQLLASLSVPVPVDDSNPIGAALRTLVSATPSEEEFTNAIPPGTEVLSATLNTANGVLTVDLSAAMQDVEGPQQLQAIAQIVFTATEFPTVTGGVRFLIEGQARSTPVVQGTRPANATVDRDDYRALDPTIPTTTTTTTTTAPPTTGAGPAEG